MRRRVTGHRGRAEGVRSCYWVLWGGQDDLQRLREVSRAKGGGGVPRGRRGGAGGYDGGGVVTGATAVVWTGADAVQMAGRTQPVNPPMTAGAGEDWVHGKLVHGCGHEREHE